MSTVANPPRPILSAVHTCQGVRQMSSNHIRCYKSCNRFCSYRRIRISVKFVRAACLRCPGNKCPLLMAFFSASSFYLPPGLLFSQKGLSYDFKILHGLLSNKNIRIHPSPCTLRILGGKGGYFEKLS